MIEIPRHENYSKNTEVLRGDAAPCVVCGKPCPTSPFSVHVHGGGSDIVTEEEASKLNDAGDLGMYPIGRNCLKQHPELIPYVSGGTVSTKKSKPIQKRKETQKWLISFYSVDGQLKDAFEHFSKTKPSKYAKARLTEGETVTIEVIEA